MPLTSKKLSIVDCKPLLEKILCRIRCWTTRYLSYAGRLQLVKSVLFGMQTYWTQIFLLPKKILKQASCRVFLWTGQANPSKKAPVAWNQVCLPRVSGGWNVISVVDWNKAAVTKNLWALSQKTDSLWSEELSIVYTKVQRQVDRRRIQKKKEFKRTVFLSKLEKSNPSIVPLIRDLFHKNR